MNETFKGLFRHAMTTIGGVLIAKGYISANLMEEVVGALCGVVGVIWSIASKQ